MARQRIRHPRLRQKIAPAVDGVVGEQLSRLEQFVETGSPTPK